MSRVRIREEVWVGEREGIVISFRRRRVVVCLMLCTSPPRYHNSTSLHFFHPLEKSLVMDGGIGINLVRTFRSHNKVHLVVKY